MSNPTVEEIDKIAKKELEPASLFSDNAKVASIYGVKSAMIAYAEQRLTTVKEKLGGIYTGHTSEEISKAKQEVKEKALTLIEKELQ